MTFRNLLRNSHWYRGEFNPVPTFWRFCWFQIGGTKRPERIWSSEVRVLRRRPAISGPTPHRDWNLAESTHFLSLQTGYRQAIRNMLALESKNQHIVCL